MEINLSENTDTNALWTCKVSLFKKYIYEGVQGKFCTAKGRPSSAKSEGATRARPLGPWILQDGENLHFATLTSKSQVSEVLRLAQLATLNPSKPFQDYIPGAQGGFENSNQVQFSPNVVRLEVCFFGCLIHSIADK